MKKFLLRYRNFKIYVVAKRQGDDYVPLRFDIYYLNQKVNGSIPQKNINQIEEAIHEYFKGYNLKLYHQ